MLEHVSPFTQLHFVNLPKHSTNGYPKIVNPESDQMYKFKSNSAELAKPRDYCIY